MLPMVLLMARLKLAAITNRRIGVTEIPPP